MATKKDTAWNSLLLNAEDKTLAVYLKDISKTKPLTSKEEAELTVRIRNGDKKALDILVKANLRFVVSVSRTYQHQGLPLIDLINEGNLGLIEAAKRFDERKNFRFISYAVWWIRQAILQLLAENSRIIRLPLNRVAFLQKIGVTERKLEQKLMRMPTTEEVAGELEMRVQDVTKMVMIGCKHTSLDSENNDSGTDLHNILSSAEDDEDAESNLNEFALRREMEKAFAGLDTRERDIIKLYFGIGYSTAHTLSEIGDRYNLTRERVRQIRLKALTKLQKTSFNGNLRVFLQ
jgi:RNA polymerase primary sigma factor